MIARVISRAALGAAVLLGCAGDPIPASRSASDPSNPGAPESPTAYTCPMHPEVTSDSPGKCPKCGMALVPKPAKP